MMKNLKIALIFFYAVFSGCKKDTSSSTSIVDHVVTATGQTTTGKKGVCFNTGNKNGTWYGNVINLKSHWFYTWGPDIPFDLAPRNCEFVPMFWGKGTVSSANVAYVKQLKALGRAKFVLGFNEPDLADQSNMSVADALASWPKLESVGLPLGSPATAWPTRKWMYDFMDQAIAQKKRVDFICVHMYVGTDDAAFVQVLKDLHDKYHKPIWITEFATAANDAATMAQNPYTPGMVLKFMQRLLPKLEALDYVQRYSWFSGDPKSARLWSSALVDASGNLTALGKWYAAYKPNTAIKK
ncbi:glycosyl hydrolase [Pedobacter hartonius]|uniref:Glycosyl hydrolase catalytic core n=1 Tax=Pedobacter hartonius TaxID=425514 RepID=A0A1H4G881_9SPHI|nr:glycosyl hydrolase [Pedobacter hartonius]SEB05815.1 Glycosyl hydrolase catalytic core [Pedobacter hartonius]